MGGITSSDDAIEFMLAGATAVAVGTANFINPSITKDIISGIRSYMKKEEISSIKDIIGKIKC